MQLITVSPIKIVPPIKQIDFATMCRAIRKELDYTQEEMARFLGVAVRTYKYWEAGEKEPSPHITYWLAETYKRLEEDKAH